MNANMKRLLILALVPVTVWGIGSTYTAIKADRIAKNTETQITMSDTVRFSSGTATTVPYLDANKDLVSSSVTPTELGYLSGVTSAIQTQLGTKTDAGTENEITLTGTTIGLADDAIFPGTGAVTLPSGTTEQQPGAPTAGMIRYNSDDASFEGYTTEWGALGGGGAGGSRLQLFDDASFESGVANGTCTGCTASQETSVVLATTESALNAASLKMAFSAASGDYTWTETTGAQYSNVAGKVSAWIKTSASDCHFVEMVDGAESQTVEIASNDEWKEYIINGTMGTTSYGYRVECNTSITDDVYVDETFAGAATADTFDIGTASLWGSVKWVATTGCNWGRASTVLDGAFPADVDCDDNARTIIGQYNSTNGSAGNSDGQEYQIKFSQIPAGTLKCESRAMHYSPVSGAWSYFAFNDGTTTTSPVTCGDGSGLVDGSCPVVTGEFNYSTNQGATTIKMFAASDSGTTQILSSSANREAEISCYHYPSPQKVVAAKCDGLECENTFSARINNPSGTPTLTSQNVSWVDSVSAGTSSRVIIDYTGLGLNTIPSVTTVVEDGTDDYEATVDAISTTSVTIRVIDGTRSATTKSFSIHLEKQGSDYKQFDQRFIPVVDEFNSDWESYTPTITGCGTPTNVEFKKRRDGADLLVDFSFTCGTSTAVAPKFSIPETPVSNTALKLVGVAHVAATSGTGYDNTAPLYVQTSGTAEIVYQNNSTVSLEAETNATNIMSSGNNIAGFVRVPISGWSTGKKAFIGNLTPKEFVQTPGSTKPVVYSVFVTDGASTTTISKEFSNWIDGVCTNPSTGEYTCTFEAGAFSSAPNCVVNNNDGANNSKCNTHSETSSAVSITCRNVGGSSDYAIDQNFKMICHGVQ